VPTNTTGAKLPIEKQGPVLVSGSLTRLALFIYALFLFAVRIHEQFKELAIWR